MLEFLILSIIGGAGLSFIFGGDNAPDEVIYDQENSQITGTDGDDIIEPEYRYDTIDAGAGNDYIDVGYAVGAPIEVYGGAGDDVIDGSEANSAVLEGGSGDDVIYIADGAVQGTAFSITVDGGDGDDTLIYAATESDIISSKQDLFISGGEGVDQFEITVHEGAYNVDSGDPDGSNTAVVMELRDFEPGVETIEMTTLVDDPAFSVTTAELDEDTDEGITDLIVTYENNNGVVIERIIEIHATGMTWDDVTFVGDTPPAILMPTA